LDVSESAASAEFSTCTPNAPQPATYPSKQVTLGSTVAFRPKS
jgi:hypothetical protein